MEPADSQLPHTPKLMFNLKELAAASGTNRTFLFKELKSGRLESIMVGRRRMVTLRMAHEWLAKLEAEQGK